MDPTLATIPLLYVVFLVFPTLISQKCSTIPTFSNFTLKYHLDYMIKVQIFFARSDYILSLKFLIWRFSKWFCTWKSPTIATYFIVFLLFFFYITILNPFFRVEEHLTSQLLIPSVWKKPFYPYCLTSKNHNFFAHDVSKLFSLLFPYFFVGGHLKAFLSAA